MSFDTTTTKSVRPGLVSQWPSIRNYMPINIMKKIVELMITMSFDTKVSATELCGSVVK
jgi:hypothetical protein